MSTILTKQIEDGVTLVTLNRPERRNALAMSLVTELTEEMKRLRHDRETRVVILNGAGQGFCSGADLVQQGDTPPGSAPSSSESDCRPVIWERAISCLDSWDPGVPSS